MKNLDCCVSACENLRTSSTKVKFYRLPSAHQVNRRRLWLQAIQQANGSTKELNGNARVCGAHFTSRVASMDPNSPDFVPSVFTKRSPKKKAKKYFTGKRRRLHKTVMSKDNLKSPSKADSPVDDQSSVLMDTNTELSPDAQTPSASSIPKDESEVTTIKPQASTPNKTSPSVKVSACTLNLNKMKPIVLLKHIVVPESGYWCALSNEDSTAESRLVRDIQLHEEQTQLVCVNCGMLFTNQVSLTQHCCAKNDEPSFPCNICHRSFPSSRYLKRHKLLHVKDARKCGKCGVLFCRRHNHVMSCPIAKAVPETEEDCSENEESNRYIKAIPEESKKIQEESKKMQEESYLMLEESYLMLEVSDLKPEVSGLKPEVSDLMPEVRDLMPEVRDLMPEVRDLKQEVRDLMPGVSDLKLKVSDLMPEVSDLKQEVHDLMPEVSNLMPEESNLLPEERNSPDEYNLIPNYSVLVMLQQSQTHEMDEDAQNAVIVTPLLTTTMSAPPIPTPLSEAHNVSYCETKPKIPISRLEKTFSLPHPPADKPSVKKNNVFRPHPPADKPSVKKNNLFRPPPPPCPAAFLKQPELPTSLKIFSPQYLTSAFLEVKRNYDYILSNPVNVQGAVVKEEPRKLPQVTPQKRITKPVKRERIAYDMEIEI
ncbi:uncharacterized protein LOC131468013 [Solea solea]|uniref:uncharacterized protein LOC131468013 n=1 Tax=Solea solea TaxID=90069 RepID=UPI00272C91BE|nr:uncharacterized protein LOC131468013 [Solea solea]